jgi:phosphatidylserine/phosphatidylglycerophosphate/cardiolipin synthase-like enzyme
MNDRTHRKLLVIDGHIGFTGGVGIADEWSGHAQDEKHWRDMHFRVEGPAVGQMQAVFMDNWIKSTGNVLHGPQYFPEIDAAGEGLAHMFSSSPSGGSDDMQLMYLMAITAATHSIHLASAYSNFDSRSFKLNDEANLNIYDRDFARRQTAVFDGDVVNAKRITLDDWRRRPLLEKLLERVVALLDSQL